MGGTKPVVVTVSNRKGGGAKTSITYHVGPFYGSRGLRVLWVDTDPQANLSQASLSPDALASVGDFNSVTALANRLFLELPQCLIHPTPFAGVSILPAGPNLRDREHPNPALEPLAGGELAEFLASRLVADNYDVVLIDTPPNLELLAYIAMRASDFVVTPFVPEQFDAEGLPRVRALIKLIANCSTQCGNGPGPHWLGLIKSRVLPRLSTHLSYIKKAEETFGELIFKNAIPEMAFFKESIQEGKPVTLYKPTSAAAKAIVAVAEELAERAGFVVPPPVKAARSRRAA